MGVSSTTAPRGVETTLVVTTSWPRTDDPVAGTFVRADARVRASAGARVIVAAPAGPGRPVGAPGVEVVDVPCRGLFGSPGATLRFASDPRRLLGLFPWVRAIEELVRLHHPSRIVAHWLLPSGWVAARAFDGPIELVAHGGDVRLLEAVPFAEHLVPRRANVTVRAVSEGLAGRLRVLGIETPVVAPLPLDDAAIADARRAPITFPLRRPVRVVASRLVAHKRIERAIERTARLGGTLVLVGDGPSRGPLLARAAEARVAVIAVGAVPHERALRMLAGADEVIAPLAEGEGAPTVVREARALGVDVAVLG